MKDYEKGATLIHTFMEQYPQSPLGKPMAFLRGDFLLHLLKSGRRDILPLVTQGYQDAVNRYGDAKEAPGALIKMAQAHSYAGNDYAALSYLNTARARYKEGEHLPLLYVTKGKVYLRLKQQGVLVVPGHNFFVGLNNDWSHKHECLRVSYAQDADAVQRGITIIAREVRRAYDDC